jgi:hypothetical protein
MKLKDDAGGIGELKGKFKVDMKSRGESKI